jgi:hypothetical protein
VGRAAPSQTLVAPSRNRAAVVRMEGPHCRAQAWVMAGSPATLAPQEAQTEVTAAACRRTGGRVSGLALAGAPRAAPAVRTAAAVARALA